jgi:bifunctional non-homologous end joining protein LigD
VSRSHGRLAEYRHKRRFDRTPEPSGDAFAAARAGAPRFVVQKHAARSLHYDVRLEHDGVLWSWSVPRGPSLAPGERRLAVRTEDHPIDYADFEGVIPEGEYGGGTVIVWDRGVWQPEGDAGEAMRKGRLTFTLAGQKLGGRWHLVRTRGGADRRERWLLFKSRDAAARPAGAPEIVDERPESALTGRTIDDVASARDRVWRSDRATAPAAFAAPLDELVRSLPTKVALTNLEKVLWPEQGLTKAALVAYYAVVAEPLLAHTAGRPLTLVRCPDGRHKECFYQKHAKEGVPDVVGRIDIGEDDGTETYMVIHDMDGLVALAQLGVLEIHTWMCHADKVERPDLLVFDLDPSPELGWDEVVATAVELRERLRALELETFVKTTGGKGLHVVAPVARRLGWDEHKAFAHGVVKQLATAHPGRYTTNPLKAQRKGRIFLDYLRNARGATAIVPYATRARAGAPVATPLAWEELERGIDPLRFDVTTVPARLSATQDPWRGFFGLEQRITAAALRAAGARR